MRISDWSSDVCSSDLLPAVEQVGAHEGQQQQRHQPEAKRGDLRDRRACASAHVRKAVAQRAAQPRAQSPHQRDHAPGQQRSEEHTSELQSLMRISYAVFCLKNKTKTHKTTNTCY